jgi:hypothetical protein
MSIGPPHVESLITTNVERKASSVIANPAQPGEAKADAGKARKSARPLPHIDVGYRTDVSGQSRR